MPRTLRAVTAFGIPIEIHPSWLVAMVLVVGSLAAQVGGWLAALVTALVFFASLVAHELAHALVARRLGIQVRSITLFVFGGVAQITEEPRRPHDELAIAAAGPLASLVFGLAMWGASRFAPHALVAPLAWLGRANVGVAVFNCLPGFPLDGGRMTRAALWALRGDFLGATVTAARIGRVLAFALVALGLWVAFSGAVPAGLSVAVVGWFLLRAATASADDAVLLAGAAERVGRVGRASHAASTVAAVALVVLSGSATACSRAEPPSRDAPAAPGVAGTEEGAPSPESSSSASQAELQCASLRDVVPSDVVRIVGSSVFYAEESSGLSVVDLSDEANPRFVASSPFVGTPLALYADERAVWVVFVDSDGPLATRVRALDTTSMKPIGEESLPGVARDVQLVGDVLYVLRDSGAGSSVASFRVEKHRLVAKAELSLEGRAARLGASAAGLAAVTLSDHPLVTWIDLPIDRPGALVAQGSARLAGGFSNLERGAGRTIDVDEDKRVRIVRCSTAACGPDDGTTLEILSFSDVARHRGSLEIAAHGGVPITRFAGERLYVASRGAALARGEETRTELRIVRTDGAPRVVGRLTLHGGVSAMAAREERLIAVGTVGTAATGVRIAVHDIDVRDASAPRLRGRPTFGSDYTWSIAEDDDRALSFDPGASMLALPFTASSAAGRYEMGAQIVDLSGPRPMLGSTYGSPGWVERVVFMDGRVVAIGRDGVHVVDHVAERPGLEIR